MLKRVALLLLTVALILMSFRVTGSACTGFAVYSEKTWYGMNFDHFIDDIKFFIRESDENGAKIFSMDFYSYDDYYPTVSMSNLGLFSSCQLVYPEGIKAGKSSDKQTDMFEVFFTAPYNTASVQDIRDFVSDRELICQYNFVHNLYADSSQDAMVLETRDNKTYITDIKGQSIIMTNFYTYTADGAPDEKVTGIGADRYVKAKKYIDSHLDAFSYEDGMTALKETLQNGGSYPTQCSLLFDPDHAEVYIVLQRNFEKVWKVSINQAILETHKGFEKPWQATLGEGGIPMKDLLAVKDEAAAAQVAAPAGKSEDSSTTTSEDSPAVATDAAPAAAPSALKEGKVSGKIVDPLWIILPIGLLLALGAAGWLALRKKNAKG